jgi:hypothetical protein
MQVSDIVTLPLQLGSAVRHRRVFHPEGVLAQGHLKRIAPPGEGLPIETVDVLARLSKAVGIPAGLPDLIGLAWRMPPQATATRPWDVLMVSAGSGLLTRFTLRPATSWPGTTLSTLMPLRHAGGWWWLKAEIVTPIGGRLSLDEVRDAISSDGIVFNIEQAHGTGSFEPLAELTLTANIRTDADHDVSFDPTRNTGPVVGLGPEWLTALRERAYLRSRRGRSAPDRAAFRRVVAPARTWPQLFLLGS